MLAELVWRISAISGHEAPAMWWRKALRVLLEMASMSDTPEEEGTEGNVDHGLGDVEALFVHLHEASPAHHPAEGSLCDPSTGQDVEAWGTFDLADRLDDEVEEGGLVRQRSEIIGAVGNEMFDPGPALTNGVENRLATGRPRCLPSSD